MGKLKISKKRIILLIFIIALCAAAVILWFNRSLKSFGIKAEGITGVRIVIDGSPYVKCIDYYAVEKEDIQTVIDQLNSIRLYAGDYTYDDYASDSPNAWVVFNRGDGIAEDYAIAINGGMMFYKGKYYEADPMYHLLEEICDKGVKQGESKREMWIGRSRESFGLNSDGITGISIIDCDYQHDKRTGYNISEKEDIEKVIDQLNSIRLYAANDTVDDFTNFFHSAWFVFRDEEGEEVDYYIGIRNKKIFYKGKYYEADESVYNALKKICGEKFLENIVKY